MPTNLELIISQSLDHKQKELAAWRDEVDRRQARRKAGEARAAAAPVILPSTYNLHRGVRP